MPWPWPELLAAPVDEGEPEPRPVVFADRARSRHFVLYGGTGAGKSRFLEALMVGDVIRRLTGASPRGAGLIDVVGDLYRNVRARLALLRPHFPRIDRLLYLVDPINPSWTVKYNPLEPKLGSVPERIADRLAYGVTTLYHDDPNVVVRMYRVLTHSFWALSLSGRSLPDLPRFLRDREFRESLVTKINHPKLIGYWFDDFPKSEREAREHVESTMNRMDRFVSDPDIEEMLRGPSTIDFRKIMDKGAVVLVNAPKAILGEGTAYLLAAFILMEFQHAAMSRLDLPDHRRRPFSLLCDEYQNYTTDTILQIVKESRKVGLELGLVTQEVM